ncbi:hypothetical protein A3I95_02390 [Candidatus Nomurabacteria bacterium RIFCSPLOWO2_02_FULL_44_12]|uniref:D-alanyl-D-alanine carboxypeptidase-like core domain-containing protein n=1 Tax=Candidatus Nomurabacteria bacterium RIFCSPLOWO2_12_FULL_44_11 TaxID=1801796 RepID=A0A1F6Y5W2_9BACT|nr:MAG: hypothetical protein A3E95_03080 [Candidatus Nomurabacteria bacterium RIFCSPHIGHO2_12_FULL_44_22b]OGJ01729.1 MAG: hypothetical protein A3G53_02060 [Candidatus Nomurabacteria bacterium RIFCSPLOWO2_12_FULL_44_11]OGJ08525.1 MAG: hypothetical protein A3I95_02390 [Candidatus Nomurabacteria bacterium RIFCSPLOWO2_02_FULL_44_12]
MKDLLPKNFDWTILGAILLGLGFFGAFFYTNYHYQVLSQDMEARENSVNQSLNSLDTKIKDLAEIFESTLTAEQKKNRTLKRELDDITEAVDTLGRVATTDRDLLKKYSKTYFLNENYSPLELDAIDPEFRGPTSGNYQVLADVALFLEDLFDAAKEDGLALLGQSAYRSFGTQSELKASYLVTYGSGANKFSADQGYSEHQLGTAIDFTNSGLGGQLEGFDRTPEYLWLLENAHKYGFILSYPAGNAYYKFEPWHWRFVGVALAKKLHADNIHFYDMDQRVIDSYLVQIFD